MSSSGRVEKLSGTSNLNAATTDGFAIASCALVFLDEVGEMQLKVSGMQQLEESGNPA